MEIMNITRKHIQESGTAYYELEYDVSKEYSWCTRDNNTRVVRHTYGKDLAEILRDFVPDD